MNTEEIINSLKSIGFTEYEAKVYISLLKQYPQNGNSLAQSSGVPGSKVYEILRKMQEKGYVFLVSTGKTSSTKRYSPLPYKNLLQMENERFSKNITTLQDGFDKILKKPDSDWNMLYNIEGYETSMDVIKNEIENAESELMMVCWNKELSILYPSLIQGCKRGVNIVTIFFDDVSTVIPWQHYFHSQITKTLEGHIGELCMVIDNTKAIIMDSEDGVSSSVISSHHSMVKTIRNYIKHDIFVNRVHRDLKDEFEAFYGKNLERFYGSDNQ
jgi:sugar-specific transcriptional regulator TrmB